MFPSMKLLEPQHDTSRKFYNVKISFIHKITKKNYKIFFKLLYNIYKKNKSTLCLDVRYLRYTLHHM